MTTVKISNQIHTTTDYFLFKPIDGNRHKNELHLNRLRTSMRENYLFTVIIVNENYEIIDGQHRFEVIKELGLPLNYIMCEGYGLDQVHILNQNSRIWTAQDYLEGYCTLGYPEYIKFAAFKKKYGFGFAECLGILLCLNSTANHEHMKIFNEGKLVNCNYAEANKIADKIELVGQYYSGYKRRTFVTTMLYLFNHKNFDFTEFIQKLKNQPTALMDCTSKDQYVTLIEEIYNYRSRNKVNLRY